MTLLRKRIRPFTFEQTASSSIRGASMIAVTSDKEASARGSLRLCVISFVIVAAILQLNLKIYSQQRDLSFHDTISNNISSLESLSRRKRRRTSTATVFLHVPHPPPKVQIRETDEQEYNQWRRKWFKSIDDEDMEERFDTDLDYSVGSCRRTNWARTVHSTCHAFHEIAVDAEVYHEQLKFLGTGTYRDAWLLRHENVVYKTSILADPDIHFNAKTFTQILTDANIMEALSASHRITDIYGHCGTSVMTESLQDTVLSDLLGGDDSKDPGDADFDQTVCQNSLTLDEKLDMAIQFTEAIAELQGFVGGVMMHGDFHSPQWLRSSKNSNDIKLNDFNKGHIFSWDGTNYCPVERCYDGSYRAPEDLRCDENGNEASDTYSLGNNLYMLLTGMWPHYEYQGKRHDLYKLISKGLKRPYIDPSFHNRSTVEDTLIRLMKACWEQDVSKRMSAFDVLKELYLVRDQLEQQEEAKAQE